MTMPAAWAQYAVPILGGIGLGTLVLMAARSAHDGLAWLRRAREAARDMPAEKIKVSDLEAQLAHATADSMELRKLLGLPPPSSLKVIGSVTGQALAAWHDPSADTLKLVAPAIDPGTGKAGD